VAAPARLVVGRVLRPHGLRGEVVVEVLTDAPERFSPGVKLAAGDPDEPASLRDLQVEATRLHQGRVLLRVAGLEDRDAVEPLRGLLLSIPFEDARGLASDEFWPHQLIGLHVVDPDGRERGVVVDVLPGAAHDLLQVRRLDGEAVLVPSVAALVTVELEAGRLVVQPLPGLLED
jgi:16S rRNA processing protein RimM